MIDIKYVLLKMMRVPKRGVRTLAFDIDTFLNPNNKERIRAMEKVLAKLPPAAWPYATYVSTRYENGKWRHQFLVHNAKMFGLKRQWYCVACLLPEKKLPTVLVDANYYDPQQKRRYAQHATLTNRTGNIVVYPVMVYRSDSSGEDGVVVEHANESERMRE